MNKNSVNNKKNKKTTVRRVFEFKAFFRYCPYTLFLILCVIGFWVWKFNFSEKEVAANNGVASSVSGNDVSGNNSLADAGVQDGGLTENGDDVAGVDTEAGNDNTDSDLGSDRGDNTEAGNNESEAGQDNGDSLGNDSDSSEVQNPDETDSDVDDEDPRRWKEKPSLYGQTVNGVYYYEPVKTDSAYYYDVGRIASSTDADYFYAEDDYFEDVCWIGDSRSVGIYDYSGWSSTDFYCDNGYCVYDYSVGGTVTNQKTGKKVTLENAMTKKQYGKIYIMIGINDSGYGNTESFQDNYKNMLDMIYESQPQAIVFLVANLHISKSAESGVFTNININSKNYAISELADGVRSFYLDYNDLFTDDDGYLIDDYTFDGFHLYAAGYMELTDFFRNHAVSTIHK